MYCRYRITPYTKIHIFLSFSTSRRCTESISIDSTKSLKALFWAFISFIMGRVFLWNASMRPSLKSSLISHSLSQRSCILWRERSSEMTKLMKFISQNISLTISSQMLSLAHPSRMTSFFSQFHPLASKMARCISIRSTLSILPGNQYPRVIMSFTSSGVSGSLESFLKVPPESICCVQSLSLKSFPWVHFPHQGSQTNTRGRCKGIYTFLKYRLFISILKIKSIM